MKKYLALLAVMAGTILNAQAQNFTEIAGVSKKSKPTEPVKLYKVISGRMEEVAAVTPSANGTFGFSFQPDYTGFYVIGSGHPLTIRDKYKLYIKGNDKINLELNDSTYVLTGQNTKENEVLNQWSKFTYNIARKSIYFDKIKGHSTYVDFFPDFDATLAKAKKWTNGKATGNVKFDNLMKLTVNYDLAHIALMFLNTPRLKHPTKEELNPYLKSFNADQFMQNEDLYKFPYGSTMLEMLVNRKADAMGSNLLDDKNVMLIPNDVLKGEDALNRASKMKSYTNFMELSEKYSKYFITADQKTRAEAFAKRLGATFKPGVKAINFTCQDMEGKQVSLTDFKGKIVLVDVWATWCKPCVGEFPFLKLLEEEFHGKDVVFLSVSVDKEQDKEKWENLIKTEKLGGVQLLANADRHLQKAYGISTIPRFMLFDKNGNVINEDAPRPSDPKLKEILIRYLSKS
ncbi:TlpA family protein disulfide reductase [Solitalea koreensis]|uniref:Peroxiredoxin n=1 Tax=Solitalea koreensis TaxID=543615 RepID=A0A521AVZ1_9SPHI|nr:TlpA disulfide reductase family protein [Solitalea koreensis]SMO38740.1 Peroxiredoxin [Solitalea koreensis]